MPRIRVPASSANIGPGFDVLGLSLDLSLEVEFESAAETTITFSGTPGIPTDPNENLITRTAMDIAILYKTSLPPLSIHIKNKIPLGRGLGSSGSAIIAAISLANKACGLSLSIDRMLDIATILEGHPDNVSASLIGGFTASFVEHVQDFKTIHSLGISHPESYELFHRHTRFVKCLSLPVDTKIRCVCVIPEYELSTSKARAVLPTAFSMQDVVFNLQRVSILSHALGQGSAELISGAMHDKMHQPYRQTLVPGLDKILEWTPDQHPGLLGVCLSGAGPTILALANSNFDDIGQEMVQVLHQVGVKSHYSVLNISKEGLMIE